MGAGVALVGEIWRVEQGVQVQAVAELVAREGWEVVEQGVQVWVREMIDCGVQVEETQRARLQLSWISNNSACHRGRSKGPLLTDTLVYLILFA